MGLGGASITMVFHIVTGAFDWVDEEVRGDRPAILHLRQACLRLLGMSIHWFQLSGSFSIIRRAISRVDLQV